MRTTFDGPSGGDEVLGELVAVREARRELGRREAALVRRARNEGIVWEQIAVSLGGDTRAAPRKSAGRQRKKPCRSRGAPFAAFAALGEVSGGMCRSTPAESTA